MPHPVAANAVAANPARARPQRHAVTAGNCIKLKGDGEGGVAFVTALNACKTFNIRWVLANNVKKNVRTQQSVDLNPLAVTACRTSTSKRERPSILALSHSPVCPARCVLGDASSGLNAPPVAAAGPAAVSAVIIWSKQWSRHDIVPEPLLRFLHGGKEQEAGWLRQSDVSLQGIRLVDEKENRGNISYRRISLSLST